MYQLQLHKTLTTEKWARYQTHQQLLMIGNEINRLLNGLKEKQNTASLRECIERCIELIDLTINCQHGSLQKELLRFRDMLACLYIMNEQKLMELKNYIKNLYIILLQLNSKTFVCI